MKNFSPNNPPFELIFDSISVGAYYRYISPDGNRRYIYFNYAMRSWFKCDDVISSPYWQQKMDDDHDTITLCTIEPYREEYPMLDENGDINKWLVFIKRRIDASILGNEGYYIVTTVIDVTDRKNNELLLEKSRLNLKIATDTAKMSTWDFNVEEKVFNITNGLDVKMPAITLDEHIMLRHYDKNKDDSYSEFLQVMSGKKETGHGLYMVKDKETGEILYRKSSFMGIKVNGKVKHMIGSTIDETEHYRFKQLIQKGRDELNLALLAGHTSIWNYTIKDKIFHSLYGEAIAANGMKYDDFSKILHPEDQAVLSSALNSIISKEKKHVSAVCRILADGEGTGYRYYDSQMMGITDDDNNIVSIIGTQKDITDDYILQAQLKEKDILNNLVVNHLLAGVILFTKDCQIVWSNDSIKNTFAKILHRKNIDSGQNCEFLINGKCIRKGACVVNKAVTANSVHIEERKIGDDTHIELTAIPVIDSEGNYTQTLLKLRDISESKKLLLELKRSKEQADSQASFISSLIDRLPCSVFIVNPDNHFKIEIANEKFCQTLSLGKDDVIGKNIEELLGKGIAKKYDSYDLMLANGKGEGDISYEGSLNVDNKERFFIITKSLVLLNGKKLILSVSADITDIKNLNAELILAKEKALEADKLKSAFLANMSHEIRTPLNAIVGFSQLLTDSDDALERSEFCKIINNNTQMLLRLIGDILDLSKIESGTTQFKRDLVDVSSFFNELTTSLALKVTNPDVKFIVDNPYKTCYINLDKLRFGQVITNFVTNAIKYTYKGYIKVGYYVERHGITIKVEDTGVGISPSKRDRVFVRFDKLDSMAQGTGLGLSIAKVLTETGGGKIWFESEEGKGSTFYSWKPFSDIRLLKTSLDEKANINPSTESESIIESHNIRRILVAEDNDSNFALLKKMLKGYEIEWVKDGIEAVEKVAKYSFDLVLMDIKMPIMDGLDATRQIRKFNSAIPIVAITANAFSMDEEDALLAGCNEFITKPILKEDLMNVLSKC